MAYRNKTFVSFASEDITSYRLMQAWHANKHIAFDFFDAHDLNTARDTSLQETIKTRLRERLRNSKQVVMLISSSTRPVSERPARFLYWEIKYIREFKLPVVFANLNGSRQEHTSSLPIPLRSQYTISVSFQPAIIRYALDDYVDTYAKTAPTKPPIPHHYKSSVYSSLGL